MDIDEVVVELYRLAESGKGNNTITDEALLAAIEGLEDLQELKRTETRKLAMINANKKQPRVWC